MIRLASPADLAREAIDAARRQGSLALLTDFDGTLAPIVEVAEAARMAGTARRALMALSAAPSVAVAVISGRGLADVRARVGIQRIIYAGCHGVEIGAPGMSFVHPAATARRPLLDRLARELAERLTPIKGARLEHKGYALAVHYRAALARGHEVARLVEEACHPYRPSLVTRDGKAVVEVLPETAWGKGRCALWILQQLGERFPGEKPAAVYMGDDASDEEACRILRGRALTIRVGADVEDTAALHRVADVVEVWQFLAHVARAFRAPGS